MCYIKTNGSSQEPGSSVIKTQEVGSTPNATAAVLDKPYGYGMTKSARPAVGVRLCQLSIGPAHRLVFFCKNENSCRSIEYKRKLHSNPDSRCIKIRVQFWPE